MTPYAAALAFADWLPDARRREDHPPRRHPGFALEDVGEPVWLAEWEIGNDDDNDGALGKR